MISNQSPERRNDLPSIADDDDDRRTTIGEQMLARDVFENINDIFFALDNRFCFAYVNRRAEEHYRIRREDVLGRSIWEIFPMAGGTVIQERYETAMREQRAVEFKVVSPFSKRILEVRAYPSADWLLVYAHDITDRRRTEARLRESDERYRLLFNSIDQGFCVCEVLFDERDKPLDFRFLEVNPVFEKITGILNSEAQSGKTARQLVPNLEDKWIEIYGRIALTGEPTRFTDRSEAMNRWFDVYGFRVGGEQSRRVAFFFNDITDRKRSEELLRRSHEELETRVAERTRELGKTNDRLQVEIIEHWEAEQSRAQVLQKFVTAQEDERRRIARDLHDQLGQQLTALRLNLESLKKLSGNDRELNEQIEQTREIARRLDADVDFLAWRLRPAVLDDLGLAAALAQYVRHWSKHFNIPTEFNANRFGETPLSPEAETNLYRIAQEALNNVCKHAGASRVNVMLEPRVASVMLIIEDNGVGFEVKQRQFGAENDSSGLGLIGMRERAALVGGTAEIESAAGAGTTVYIKIPFANDEQEREK